MLLTIQPAWRPWPVHAGVYGLALNVALLAAWGVLRPATDGDAFLKTAAGRSL